MTQLKEQKIEASKTHSPISGHRLRSGTSLIKFNRQIFSTIHHSGHSSCNYLSVRPKRYGVVVLGGHDHLYFIGRGVSSWDNFNVLEKVLGAELDNGEILIVKSGSDFRDLSEIKIVLESTPKGSVRNKIVKSITGCCQFFFFCFRGTEGND